MSVFWGVMWIRFYTLVISLSFCGHASAWAQVAALDSELGVFDTHEIGHSAPIEKPLDLSALSEPDYLPAEASSAPLSDEIIPRNTVELESESVRTDVFAAMDPSAYEYDPLSEGDLRRSQHSANVKQGTQMQLSAMERRRLDGTRSNLDQADLNASSHASAKQLSEAAKNMEIERFTEKVDPQGRGEEMLRKNPELETPGRVLMGAAFLWTGRSFKVLKSDDFVLRSSLGVRDRSAAFNWSSSLFDGELKFRQIEEIGLSLAHTFAPVQMTARAYYEFLGQTFQTSISKMILPMLDLTLRAGQENVTRQIERAAVLSFRTIF